MTEINFDFASEKPLVAPTIDEIREINAQGPWKTKSDGELHVHIKEDYDSIQNFFTYDQNELENVPEGIRGFRIYSVKKCPANMIGGTEFHRIRQEFIFGLEGIVDFEFEDVYGNIKKMEIDDMKGFYLPHFILHTYLTKKEKGIIIIIANTLYDAEDPRTHDTYSVETFRKLQEKYR